MRNTYIAMELLAVFTALFASSECSNDVGLSLFAVFCSMRCEYRTFRSNIHSAAQHLQRDVSMFQSRTGRGRVPGYMQSR